MRFGISNSPLSNRIFVGRINKKGTEYLEKQDMTFTAINAVIEHILSKNEDGEEVALSDDKKIYVISVKIEDIK